MVKLTKLNSSHIQIRYFNQLGIQQKMTRGEIWWVDYGIPYGSELGYRRPVIIIHNVNYIL
jgi:hypothetical protein